MTFRKRGFRAMVLGLLAAAGLALAPAAFAHGHFGIGIDLPGVSLGYWGGHHHGGYVGINSGYNGGYGYGGYGGYGNGGYGGYSNGGYGGYGYGGGYYEPTYYAPTPVYYDTYYAPAPVIVHRTYPRYQHYYRHYYNNCGCYR